LTVCFFVVNQTI